jgi:predicted DCC family thiol-disulfide oxidoreductase YuxK
MVIVLFDGICNFCNNVVQFLYARDKNHVFRFASLQSETGQKLLGEHGIPLDTSTVVVIENEKAYLRSTGALRTTRYLNKLWPLVIGLLVVPRPIRDFGYDLIANNRYKWFGKHDSCPIPSKGLREQFLDWGP